MSTNTVNIANLSHFLTLGFTEKESQVFMAVIELGRCTAQAIARQSKLPRTTVYFVLDSLVQKAIVIEEKKKSTRYFSIEKPQVLSRQVEQEQKRLQTKARAAVELEKIVAPFFNRAAFSVPSLQFFEGKEAVKKMCFDYIQDWHASMLATDNIWWGYQDDKFVIQYREFLEHYWKLKAKTQKIQLFSNQSDLEKVLKVPNRVIRPVPNGLDFQSTFWICGEYVIVIVHTNRPQYAFQLKDKVLARNLANIFALLWKSTSSAN